MFDRRGPCSVKFIIGSARFCVCAAREHLTCWDAACAPAVKDMIKDFFSSFHPNYTKVASSDWNFN